MVIEKLHEAQFIYGERSMEPSWRQKMVGIGDSNVASLLTDQLE